MVHSDVARAIWDHFALILQKPQRVHSIAHMYRVWLQGGKRRSQMGMTTLALILYGMWEIWKIWCKMKFEDEKFDAHKLLRRIYHHLNDINRIHPPKREPTQFEKFCIERLNITVRTVVVRKGRWVNWTKPEQHDFKLNVDGSCKGSIGAGGGLVRDRQGDFLFGFSMPCDHSDALGAEIQALYEGLLLCRRQRIVRSCIELDAALVFNMLNDKAKVQWRYVYLMRRVKAIISEFDTINLIFREQNMTADHLAKSGIGSSSKKEYLSIQTLPRSLHKIIFLDI